MRVTLRWFMALAIALTGVVGPSIGSAQAAGTPENRAAAIQIDGKSPATAAASCYEIKQLDSRAPSGTYWLYTPELKAPQQFYCDQTTDGGGWVLIGAGRESWEEHYEGHGNFSQLASQPTGTFAQAAQYPAKVVDGLLNGERVDQLSDGIRLRRATNTSGSSTQDVRFQFADRDRWVWTFGAWHLLSWYSFDGRKYQGGNLPEFGADYTYNYVNFNTSSAHRWALGFAYGPYLFTGNTNSNTHLYATTLGSPRPTTHMYIRPKLTQASLGLEPIADSGTTAIENKAIASSYAARGAWGVTGNQWRTNREGDVEAQAFAQIGDVVYVGGNFSTVQRGASGTRVNQPALAAFDAKTGEWIDSFRPQFNHQVKSLVALPDGHLLVGGQFSSVNGKPAPGIVKLDPATGDVSADWTLHLENRVSGGVRLVRYLEVEGDHVYLGGSFTHLRSSPESHAIYSRNHARFNWKTGRPDPTWNPEFNGGVMDGSVDTETGNVYAAGYFTQSRGYTTHRVAAWGIETTDNQRPRRWDFIPSGEYDRGSYQQAITTAKDRVYVGGAQHAMFGYDQASLERTSGSITTVGGDFQTAVDDENFVYAGCHCEKYNFQDTYKHPLAGWKWTQADQIRWIGAWDAATGEYAPEFSPPFLRSNNAGAWASFIDDNETLWVGGDFTGARVDLHTNQWVGGFVRFPMRDHTAPTMNPELRVQDVTDSTVSLTWRAASDDVGVTGYEILRDDRVIATTTSTSITVDRAGEDRYFVRAVDAAGNRSASTPVAVADGESAQGPLNTAIWSGEEWDYWYQQQAPGADWATVADAGEGWVSARTPIGFGSSIPLETKLDQTFDQRPAAFYARKSFLWEGTSEGKQLDVSTWADDGIVVYVNGHEIGRHRMAEGSVGHNTFAHAAISSANAVKDPVVFTIPEEYLVEGENVIAVSVHVNYRNSPNMSFDLTLEEAPQAAPPAGIAAGEEWDYWYQQQAPGADWATGAGDGWVSAPTPIGFGSSIPLETKLDQTFDQRPAAFYARKSFLWEGTTPGKQLDVSTWADDGIVVYVNGHEIGRHRMAEGSVGHNTFAHAAISSANAVKDPVVFTIPEEYLVEGENVIAVSVHVNYRNSPNMSFDLTLEEVPLGTEQVQTPAQQARVRVAEEEAAQIREADELEKTSPADGAEDPAGEDPVDQPAAKDAAAPEEPMDAEKSEAAPEP